MLLQMVRRAPEKAQGGEGSENVAELVCWPRFEHVGCRRDSNSQMPQNSQNVDAPPLSSSMEWLARFFAPAAAYADCGPTSARQMEESGPRRSHRLLARCDCEDQEAATPYGEDRAALEKYGG
jgi:hypothetical protein